MADGLRLGWGAEGEGGDWGAGDAGGRGAEDFEVLHHFVESEHAQIRLDASGVTISGADLLSPDAEALDSFRVVNTAVADVPRGHRDAIELSTREHYEEVIRSLVSGADQLPIAADIAMCAASLILAGVMLVYAVSTAASPPGLPTDAPPPLVSMVRIQEMLALVESDECTSVHSLGVAWRGPLTNLETYLRLGEYVPERRRELQRLQRHLAAFLAFLARVERALLQEKDTESPVTADALLRRMRFVTERLEGTLALSASSCLAHLRRLEASEQFEAERHANEVTALLERLHGRELEDRDHYQLAYALALFRDDGSPAACELTQRLQAAIEEFRRVRMMRHDHEIERVKVQFVEWTAAQTASLTPALSVYELGDGGGGEVAAPPAPEPSTPSSEVVAFMAFAQVHQRAMESKDKLVERFQDCDRRALEGAREELSQSRAHRSRVHAEVTAELLGLQAQMMTSRSDAREELSALGDQLQRRQRWEVRAWDALALAVFLVQLAVLAVVRDVCGNRGGVWSVGPWDCLVAQAQPLRAALRVDWGASLLPLPLPLPLLGGLGARWQLAMTGGAWDAAVVLGLVYIRYLPCLLASWVLSTLGVPSQVVALASLGAVAVGFQEPLWILAGETYRPLLLVAASAAGWWWVVRECARRQWDVRSLWGLFLTGLAASSFVVLTLTTS